MYIYIYVSNLGYSFIFLLFRTNTFAKGTTSFITPAIDEIVSILFFYKDSFASKWPTKTDMPLNRNKPIKTT